MLDVRNSTQASGSSVNLVLSDMSSIQAPEVVVQDEDDNENEIILRAASPGRTQLSG